MTTNDNSVALDKPSKRRGGAHGDLKQFGAIAVDRTGSEGEAGGI
jgi:hypothetical protein